MKKKLIIHNGNISIGGQEKMLIEFLSILDPEKYDVLLLIEEDNGERNDYQERIPSWIKYKFLTTKEFMNKIEITKKSKNILMKFYYSFLLKIKKKIALNEFKKYLSFSDIIIDYDMGLLRNLHKIDLQNKILVGWSHAGEGELSKNKNKRKNIERYDYIVTINEKMKKGYEQNTNHPKILKIYNFLDFDSIQSKAKEKIEENYKEYIINVGSLTDNKNQEFLINIFKILKEKYNRQEKLLIIGEGKAKEKLEYQIKKLRLEKDIFLLGQKKNPYKYIEKSLMYVLSSKTEGFSLTLLEAMNLKKMVVSTISNGPKEIIQNNKYGVLIEDNIEKAAQVINFYLNNVEEKEKYEKLSFERSKIFSKEIGQKKIEEFIEKL